MSGPGIVDVIAESFRQTDIKETGKVRSVDYYRRRARAVLAALEAVGAREWGTETVHETTGDVLDRDIWQTEKAAREVNRKYGDRVVSRVVTPWEAS